MRIFVLSGQSNMAGRGGVHRRRWDGVVPPECAPCPSILRLSAELEWEEAREPLHADIDTAKTCGVGPGMVFARAVLPRLEAPGVGVGLVPCAVGGTAIREWARGERLYDQMVRRARAAAECGEIEAVLWYQGESDAESDAETAAYQGNMESLIANVRADLGMPQLPFIQLVFSSSAAVYGSPKNSPCTEEFPLTPNNPYGKTKLVVEDICHDIYRTDPEWKITLLRYFNPVGAYPSGYLGEDPCGIPNNLMPFA